MVSDLNFINKSEWLLRVTDSHVHCKSDFILKQC